MKIIAAASAAVLAVVFAAPAFAEPLTDTNLDASSATTLQSQPVADTTNTMPGNPNADLPDKVSGSIPDNAMVVSENLAVTKDGKVKNVETGKTVTDPKLVGTKDQQPDPLAKTNGDSFIPVEASEVKQAVADSSGAKAKAVNKTKGASTDGSTKVRLASLGNGEYGAYWGTYNGSQAFFDAGGNLFAQNAKGVVDVSEWQGQIDWAQAKANGVEGAIIRLTYGWGNGYDKYALYNISECKRLGIPFGIYMYSYAYNQGGAVGEGQYTAQLLQDAGVSPSDLSYPVYYDLEQWTWTGYAPPTSPAVYDQIVDAWYGQMQAAGYSNLGVYSYTSYLNGPLNSVSIHAKTSWVAQYAGYMGFTDWFGTSRGWQYTSGGSVPGIAGTADLNAFGSITPHIDEAPANSVYRLYNPNSGLHHYTIKYSEASDLATAGWRYEGIAFRMASSGSPVYRLYNPNDGNHFYTFSTEERSDLVRIGWNDEGVAWYVDPSAKIPVYRLYNAGNGEHMYTVNSYEYEQVGQSGWNQEGIAWKANS